MSIHHDVGINENDYIEVIDKNGVKQKKKRVHHTVSYMGETPVTTNQFLGCFPIMPEYHCSCGFNWWGVFKANKHCLREKELVTRMHGKGTY